MSHKRLKLGRWFIFELSDAPGCEQAEANRATANTAVKAMEAATWSLSAPITGATAAVAELAQLGVQMRPPAPCTFGRRALQDEYVARSAAVPAGVYTTNALPYIAYQVRSYALASPATSIQQ